MKHKRMVAALAALSLTAVLAPVTQAVAAPATTQLILGAVPGLDLGLIELAKVRGSFAAEGLDIKIVPLDSGPNVVVGVVAGQYDLGYTAYAPPLLAYANGSPLRIVSGVGTVGKDGLNGGTLVRKDSGINSWKDLAGKKIASNAPRSLFSLTVPAAIAAAGGDASKIQIIPLPFSEIPKAVADGRVDAGVALEPFLSKGLADYPTVRNLGDSTHAVLPEGSPVGVVFTSASTLAAKSDAIARFKKVFDQTVKYANKHLNSVKIAGAAPAGLTKAQALAIKIAPYETSANPAGLKSLVDLMVKFNWVQKAPDLTAFFSKS
ncbi:MAG: ABC transporter substrate-binding protein [Actinomycetota bacterium]|nr:ABC transporter substrate-binding protein [Actinomycetota bacterium]